MTEPKRTVLAVDLDDTVLHYLKGFTAFLRTKGFKVPDNFEADFFDLEKSGLVPAGSFNKLHGEAIDAGMFKNLAPLEGAVDMLQNLSGRGYEINLVTSRFVNAGQHRTVLRDTAECLDAIGIPYDNILFLKEKWRFEADSYVDDAPHNLEALAARGRHVIALDQRYNRHLTQIDRGKNWAEVDALLRSRYNH